MKIKEIIVTLCLLLIFSIPVFLLGYFIAKAIVLGIVLSGVAFVIFCLLIITLLWKTNNT